jgi:integral membrane protein
VSDRIHPVGRLFRAVAYLEAVTWAALLLGMGIKYGPIGEPVVVSVAGALHGVVFLVYVAVAVLAAWRLRWRWWVTLLALASSVPPLATVVLELWLQDSGRLTRCAPEGRPSPALP